MSTDPLIGRQLANYRLDRVLGQGGMARVYYGWDVKLDRPVAVKVIDDFYQQSEGYAERFIREAKVIAGWRHENIVQIYYADQEESTYFYAMEYIDGETLADRLKRMHKNGEQMPQQEALRIGYAVASALDYAHQRGVVHRDVKPSNIMIASDNRIILTDFGLALQMTEGSIGQIFGSPHYIAPEQARRSSDAVPSSDIYSLGVIMYELLAGRVPFEGDSLATLALKHLNEAPPPPTELNADLNEATEQTLLKSLSKQPDDRHPSGTALLKSLEHALLTNTILPDYGASTDPIKPARLTQPSGDMALPRRSSSVMNIVYAVLALLIIGGGAYFFWTLENDDSGGDNNSAAAVRDTATPTETDVPPTATVTRPTETELPPTDTEVPASSTPEPTDAPTDTPVPSTATPEPPTSTPEPTILYPDGRLVRLLYNPTSFYLINDSPRRIDLRELDIQAMGANGRAAQDGNTTLELSGREWTGRVGYNYVDSGRCVKVEIFNRQDYIAPDECERPNLNASFSPSSGEHMVVWRPRDGVEITEFRVVFNGQEIGRCPLAEDGPIECEVRFP